MKALFLAPVACFVFVSASFAQNYPPHRYIVQQTEGAGVTEPQIFIPRQAETTHSIGSLNSEPATSGTPTLASPAADTSSGTSSSPTTFQGSATPGSAIAGTVPSTNGQAGPVARDTARIDTTAPAQIICPPCPAVPAATPAPAVAYRPVVPVFRMPRSYVVGRGILGQPKVYVPGQPVRNTVRWLTP